MQEATISRTGATFNLLVGDWYPAVEATVIDPDASNAMLEDIAQGLTDSVSRDGAGSMSGDLNMGTHKLTNLAAGSAAGHSVRYEQVQLASAVATAWEGLSWAAGKIGAATGASSFTLFNYTTAGMAFLNYTDPNADALVYWKDADGTVASVSLGTGLAFSGGSLSLDADLVTWAGVTPGAGVATFISTPSFANLAAAVTGTWNLPSGSQLNGTAFGTAAVKNTGTSGNNVALADAAMVWSGAHSHSANITLDNNIVFKGKETGGTARELIQMNASNGVQVGDANNGLALKGSSITYNNVAVPTISSSDTLSNKTLSNPTVSGTIGGAPAASGQWTHNELVTINRAAIPLQLNNSGGGSQMQVWYQGANKRSSVGADASNAFYLFDASDNQRLAITQGGDPVIGNVGPTSVYSLGYRGIYPRNASGAGSITFILADAGVGVYSGSGSGVTWTIPPNSSVAFPIGTCIPLMNLTGGNITIAEGSGVTLYRFDGTSGTGSRTLPSSGFATLVKFDTNLWAIVGVFS